MAWCALTKITYATYVLLAIGWDRLASDKPLRYQQLVWNETKQDLTEYSRQWH